jgi:hypothetical protein
MRMRVQNWIIENCKKPLAPPARTLSHTIRLHYSPFRKADAIVGCSRPPPAQASLMAETCIPRQHMLLGVDHVAFTVTTWLGFNYDGFLGYFDDRNFQICH